MVYASGYVTVIKVRNIIQSLTDLDLYAIELALYALSLIIGFTVAFHFISHRLGKNGWMFLLILAPIGIAIGGVWSESSQDIGLTFLLAGVTCLFTLLDPTRMKSWINKTLGLGNNGRLFVVTGMFGFLLLFYTVLVSYYFCDVLYSFFTYSLMGIGILWMELIRRDVKSGKTRFLSPEDFQDGVKCKDAPRSLVAISWLALFAWHSFFVAIFLLWRDLIMFASYSIPVPINLVGYVQITCFIAGLIITILLRLKLRENKKKSNLISLICLILFSLLLMLLLKVQVMLSDTLLFVIRLVMLVLLTPAFSGVYLMDIPRLQMKSLNFFKGYSLVLSAIFFIAGGVLIDQTDFGLFNIIYYITMASCFTVLVFYQIYLHFKERRVVNDS